MSENRSGTHDMQLVLFRLGKEEFGVDVSQVVEIIRVCDITQVPNAPGYIEGLINLRGHITTIINLRKKMNMSEKPVDASSRIIVVDTGSNKIGMMVDSVTEVKYISKGQIDDLPGILSSDIDRKYIQGVCKLQDRLLMLVDLRMLVSESDISISKEYGQDQEN